MVFPRIDLVTAYVFLAYWFIFYIYSHEKANTMIYILRYKDYNFQPSSGQIDQCNPLD